MPTTWLRRIALRKILVFCVTSFILWKLYQIWLYTGSSSDLPPPQHMADKSHVWKFETNSQGISQDFFNTLMSKIDLGDKIESSRPIPDNERNSDKVLESHALPVVARTYRSEGSLTFKNGEFFLDGKGFRILSGAMHYFRVVPEYWKDRIRKMKACGLNTVETYVSWNLHEDTPGHFNFEGILNLRKFIQFAAEEDLYVILRPGPYICSEWDFGGLPAWLLKDPDMKVRSNYGPYKDAVKRYFGKLIPMISDLQHSKGGPIIAVQIENEFGSYSDEIEHLKFIKQLLLQYGIKELLFVSDGFTAKSTGFHVAPFYDETLPTVNFMKIHLGETLFKVVKTIDKEFPLMVMEFWAGWFDHWENSHKYNKAQFLAYDLQQILLSGASVNFYMFHGGTNFGFTAGANWFNGTSYKPDVTSYDYNAPLSEAGDITPKYELIRAIIQKYVLEPMGMPILPDIPPNTPKGNYGTVTIQKILNLEDMISTIKPVSSQHPLTMEQLEINNGYGQNYGFILYRTYMPRGKTIRFTSPAQDRAIIIVNGLKLETLTWTSRQWEVRIPTYKLTEQNMLEILVEHQGRVNYVHKGFNRFNEERKGIRGEVYLDDLLLTDWKIYPLEFKEPYLNSIIESHKWKPYTNTGVGLTSLYQGDLIINATPRDTFLNLQKWEKGVAFVNGFNLGRYWNAGPQGTLFVPAPILKTGTNKIVIFELYRAAHTVLFQDIHETDIL
ncbi:Beta-galactosidase-1-like protein 2 [Mactra antiquata]